MIDVPLVVLQSSQSDDPTLTSAPAVTVTVTVDGDTNNSANSNENIVAGIVGGVLGTVAVIASLAAIAFFIHRRRRVSPELQPDKTTPDSAASPSEVQCYPMTASELPAATSAIPHLPVSPQLLHSEPSGSGGLVEECIGSPQELGYGSRQLLYK